MNYKDTIRGTFIRRPNRFVAEVLVDGCVEMCHVKNTGRCKELLVEGYTVILQRSDNADRKTGYDLIAVYKGDRLINMDSQVPNEVVAEGLSSIGLVSGLHKITREVTYGDSRFDILAEGNRRCFIEVKGVTLEENGHVLFPDAPTERGLKHIRGLIRSKDDGYDPFIFFLIQMSDVEYFTPNYRTHKEFGLALKDAEKAGVHIVAYDCNVTENSITIGKPVKIRLD